MSVATMTLIGLYNYDSSLFDLMEVPEEVDKEVLINRILQTYGEMEPTYLSHTYLKNSFGYWSKAHKGTFEKWIEGFKAQYSPIENYDRYEEYEDSGEAANQNKSNSKALDKVSGYNSSQLVDNSENNSDLNSEGSSNFVNKHKAHLHGNIGVTESTTMLKNFWNLYTEKNIYSMIADLFADEYIIRLY